MYDKTAAKKRWSLSKIGFLEVETPFTIYFLLATCNVCPVANKKSLCKHKDPITGNLLIASVGLIFNSMIISCRASDLLIQ